MNKLSTKDTKGHQVFLFSSCVFVPFVEEKAIPINSSCSFDRAADFYDTTRAYPPEVADKIIQSILDLTHATPQTRIFELGIGTGRISAPLIARGLNVTGLDLSREMMNRLRDKIAPGTPLRLVQGDAGVLPFSQAAFDAVLATHVFHLIAPWEQAIRELQRVLRPGGLVLHSTNTRDPQSGRAILRSKWQELVEAHGETWHRPGAPGSEAVTAEFQTLGASVENVQVVRSRSASTPRQEIANIAARVHSATWAISDAVLQATVAELTEWARDRFGALDAPLLVENAYAWQVLRFDHAPLLPEPIRATLARLAPILNATGALWVLGGSGCLALHGVPITPHDLDIVTDRDGAYRIGQALQGMTAEKLAVHWSESERIRSHRGLYQMGDVQVDIVGAAEMREGDEWMPAKPPSEWQTEIVTVPGTDLRVAIFTLEHALVAYQRLGRAATVRLIKEQIK